MSEMGQRSYFVCVCVEAEEAEVNGPGVRRCLGRLRDSTCFWLLAWSTGPMFRGEAARGRRERGRGVLCSLGA